jgi:hypothetical protein
MSATIKATTPDFRSELVNWRERLESAADAAPRDFELNGLLREVRNAIERLSAPESRAGSEPFVSFRDSWVRVISWFAGC